MKRMHLILLLGVIMTLFSCSQQDNGATKLPDLFELEMVAKKFHWETRYPGLDGRLYTEDDFFSTGDIHLPKGVRTEISLKSEDYLYAIQVPALEKRSVAVPGLERTISFYQKSKGTFKLLGDQLCGFKHETLNKQIIFTNHNHFIKWSLKKSK